MKLKLDENLGERGRQTLTAAGHEVCTVAEQRLEAATDRELIARCAAEGRALVTLDLDFGNPLLFPPVLHAGVAVLRLPRRATAEDLDRAIATLAADCRVVIHRNQRSGCCESMPSSLIRGHGPACSKMLN